MKEYKITPKREVFTIQADSPEEAIVDFATTMDSDMNIYFDAEKADYSDRIVADNENGTVYRMDKHMNIYCLRRRTYRDGTSNWLVGVEAANDRDRHMALLYMRGSKEDAQRKCWEFI